MKTMKTKHTLKSKKPLKAKVSLKAKAKPKKQVKPSVSKLKKEADKWHSLAIRLSEADKDEMVACITCERINHYKKMQCGHFMSRQHNTTRYHFKNTAPQCYGCNVMQQGKQYEFGRALDKRYGEGTALAMYYLSRNSHQLSESELQEIIQQRKELVSKYSNDKDRG